MRAIDDQCTDAVRVVRGGGECDDAAHRMSHERGAPNAGMVEDGDDIGRPPAARIGGRIVRLAAAAMAAAIDEDQPPFALQELLDITGLMPGLTAFGYAVKQHKRLAVAEVFISDRDAVLGNSLGKAVRGGSIDQ